MKFRKKSPLIPVRKRASLLSGEEKVFAVGTFVGGISCFLPWFSLEMGSGKPEIITYLGVTGLCASIGFFVLFFCLFSGTLLWTKLSAHQFSFFSPRSKWYFGSAFQSLFLLVLALLIYSKYSMNYTNAGTSFGLWIGILGECVALGAAYNLIVLEKKETTKEIFQPPKMDHASLQHEEIKKEEVGESVESRQMNFGEYTEEKKTDIYPKR